MSSRINRMRPIQCNDSLWQHPEILRRPGDVSYGSAEPENQLSAVVRHCMSSWDWNVVVFEAFNGLAGRMPVLDKLIGLPLRNDFIKAGLFGACFLAAWYARVPSRRRRAIRGTLLMTMIGTVFALAASQVVCHFSHIPRPYVLSQDVQKFDGRQLVPQQSWPFRVPL